MTAQTRTNSSYLPPLLFCITLFVSATLLFWIQPLIAKKLLPLLGGSPSVWNTCILFFQTLLLLGYLYALALTKWLSLRLQTAVHVLLIALITIYLFTLQPTSVEAVQYGNPTLWLLKTLFISVGLPFFILSASGPLLQSWFSKLKHPLSVDPYFLFAASNAGSLIALVAFPLVLEPTLVLNHQYKVWRTLFVVLAALTAVVVFTVRPKAIVQNQPETSSTKSPILHRLRWLALSAVPSSLMLGVTTYVTADVAAVPLLWVIPLALYLITFVIAFSNKPFASQATLNRVMVMGAILVTLILASGATEPAWILILANLGFFFFAALVCHTQLANDRPGVSHLAEYYLWIAVGGALGSLFNVLIAPVVFRSIVEYPLVIAIACMLQRSESKVAETKQAKYFDVIYPIALFVLTVGLALLVAYLHVASPILKVFVVLGVPLMIINHFFRQRPVRLALSLCAVMLASVYYSGSSDRTLHTFRNFFGSTRVTADSGGKINSLHSGNTIHGRQFAEPPRRCEPLSYHHDNGPLGQIMAVFNAGPANPRIGVIGLGVGAMAAYSQPGQQWTFYEIDKDIIQLARHSRHFTYLQDCMKGSLNVVEGDARLSLQNARESQFGLIVLDAFSSDAIPIHLVTQEALDLYLSKLADGGIMAFHISNRSLDLKPILADLAASRKLMCFGFDDLRESSLEGKDPSQWVVMSRSPEEISNLSINSQWKRLYGTDRRVWTDDFSNIFRAIKWRE